MKGKMDYGWQTLIISFDNVPDDNKNYSDEARDGWKNLTQMLQCTTPWQVSPQYAELCNSSDTFSFRIELLGDNLFRLKFQRRKPSSKSAS